MKKDSRENTPQHPSSYLNIHKQFVTGMKKAMNKVLEETGREGASADLPIQMGMRRLMIPAPPMLEAAFGYRGDLRYVSFFYSPRNAAVAHSDGGDDLPVSNANDWVSFATHPAMCSELDVYPSLFGRVGNKMLTPDEFQQLPEGPRANYCKQFHALVLDRLERRLYVSGWEALKMFQPCAEPDEEVHTVLLNGKLVSPGNEDYEQPPDQETVAALFSWLDERLAEPVAQEKLASWHVDHSRPEEARLLLERIAREHPERVASPGFQYVLAFLFEETHDYAAAVSALEKARPQISRVRDPHLLLRLGSLYLRVNRYEDALQQLLQVGSIKPQMMDESWHVLCARACTGLGDLPKAAAVCADWLGRSDEDLETGEVYAQLAEIAALGSDFRAAADYCRRAVEYEFHDLEEFTSRQPVAVYRMGWWFSAQARLANAARHFEAGVEQPVSREMAFGYLYLGMTRYQDATIWFRRARETAKSAEAIWLLALSLLATKQKDQAEEHFHELQELFPADERGYVGLALLHAAQGTTGSALVHAEAALKMNPRSGETHALLAYLHWSNGRYAAARDACEQAERWGFPVHYKLADVPGENGEGLNFITIDPRENNGVLS